MIALVNFLLAVVMLIVAQRLKVSREMELTLGECNSAVRALEMNAQALQQQLVEVQRAGKRSWVSSATQLTRLFQVSRAARRCADQRDEEAVMNHFIDLPL
ncbi:hypothetical protein KHP60_00765 [Microvirga sp. 3-52]|uniref:hypothetical protein n=1 Tax=Microvirga sp. 3-52 TaxID=2792425 RepID=UPI001AC4DC44|nr:hypothetical protein [Microvirga sp. 3-52]MBO1903530.1 hypothetical protein [Microvirga sp. 3-52]MBS7450873.1 hypothetical protein [Microvirga sp. 3-52]